MVVLIVVVVVVVYVMLVVASDGPLIILCAPLRSHAQPCNGTKLGQITRPGDHRS